MVVCSATKLLAIRSGVVIMGQDQKGKNKVKETEYGDTIRGRRRPKILGRGKKTTRMEEIIRGRRE